MSAQLIFDFAPLGSTVTYSDGTPRPTERFPEKLAAWERSNNTGRLIRKQSGGWISNIPLPASITLQEDNYDSPGVVALTIYKIYPLSSDLKFVVRQCPAIGSVRILNTVGEHGELLHLAPDHATAAAWLGEHPHVGAVLEEVTADDVAAAVVEGRAAA